MSTPTNGSGTSGRDAARELLGAYVLDAVDDIERATVDRALEADTALRDEAEGLRRATTPLHDADGPGPDVWSRIEARLADGTHRSPTVVPLATAVRTGVRRTGTRRRQVVRVVAIAAAAAALAGMTA